MKAIYRYIFILFFSFTTSGLAQTTGSLSGYVLDATTGDALIGATIQIDSSTIGGVTDINGFYTINNIATGSVNITVQYIGYKPAIRYNVIIKSVSNPDLNFQLQPSSIGLSEITVRPDPFIKDKMSPLSVQSLTTEEIATYPGGNNDIAKVVQSFPGVSGSVLGFRNDIIIRGGAPNEVVYYLDGIEIPNINHFATQGSGGGPVSLLNVSFFESVELNTSAFSSKYDNALSGILQFNQRNGNNRQIQTNIRISGTETALTFEGPLFKGEKTSSNTSYIISARRSYLQFLFKLIGLSFLPDYWDFQTKVSHKINDNNELTFIGLGAIDDFAINVPDDITDDVQAQLDQIPIQKQNTATLGMSWNKRFKQKTTFLRTSLSYNTLDNDFKRYSDNENEAGLFFSNDSRESEIKLRSELTTYIDKWKIDAGISIQRADYSNITVDLINDNTFTSEIDFFKYGLFAQGSGDVIENKLSVAFGIRTDGNTITENGNKLQNTLSPRFSLSYKLDKEDKWRLNASSGIYYKLPSYTTLGYKDTNSVLVNKNSAYIRSTHFTAGLEYLPKTGTRVNIEGFYKLYDNYPVSISDSVSLANLGGSFEIFGSEAISSVGLGRTYGIELSYQQKLTDNFFALLALTFYRSEYTGFDKNTYLPSLWDSRQLVSFTGGYKLINNWELGAKFRFAGKTPFAPTDIDATTAVYPDVVLDYSKLGDKRLRTFSSLDLRIDKKWNFKKWSFDAYIDITNVYAAAQPSPPVYILQRDANGDIVSPRQLKEIEGVEEGNAIPTLGIIIDF